LVVQITEAMITSLSHGGHFFTLHTPQSSTM